MVNIEPTPKKENPRLFDVVFQAMQTSLVEQLPWLNHAFGKAERLVKMIGPKKVYSPNVYIGNNEYELISPDSDFGNYSFFTMDDPQAIDFQRGQQTTFKTPFSIVFWVDMRTIEDIDERNTEAVKQQIIRALNGGMFLRSGTFRFDKVYEKSENVFHGFSLDEIDNQFLMHPYCGWRFAGEITITDTCEEV